ncbi:hypothetical protein kac65v162_gp044 [Nodularia phage vB_NspS-kac65v162]|jgi:hypothetical protein|uniref:Uncharacterized protein n=3 Tax=Ravarandavirus kac65v151 TaxID=2845689 RepID=A0A482MIZ2_9CAUD|nr:hypothetical protein HWC12_gp044 [Nodularia phage vB_NspS-kac65v151]QBQ73076.1 hypothetical protein kac65v151_gp044 [Nodularia phage vB_NspS-kac65v151]QBQ73282.1 hypothetical protein kac65v161_gp044 [Nodularia phage vB_NspS-kac65v161]QBQ73488.1 hypothetical protein kac65v162_gp044 [Nodularia phage vB_NspS-kac65v162]
MAPNPLPFAPKLLTSLPSFFYNLPLTGTVQINRQFEQHPSGQLELESTLSKNILQSIFKPGKEFNIYGIPFRINNIQIQEMPRSIHPDSRCRISVSLGGRWENNVGSVAFLRGDGTNNPPVDVPFLDPDCVVPDDPDDPDPNKTTTVQNLLSKIGIPYQGSVTLNPVNIPENTPLDAVVDPIQLLEERVRIANAFIRWSNPNGVEVSSIDVYGGAYYPESEIYGAVETSYEAIDKSAKNTFSNAPYIAPSFNIQNSFPSTITPYPVPTIQAAEDIALGFEYPNVELTGEFSDPLDTDIVDPTQGNYIPTFTAIDLTTKERIEGDEDAPNVLEGVDTIKTMSLCFDIGGTTKSRSIITESGGTITKQVDETYGFAFIADDLYSASTGGLDGIPSNYWQLIRQVTTTYNYDIKTGYLLSTYAYGFQKVRYKQESTEAPQTLQLGATDPEFELYQFFDLPTIGRSSKYLEIIPEYKFSISDFLVQGKECNPDGTSSPVFVKNLNYAPPYYVKFERSETVSYKSRENPENTGIDPGSTDKLLPRLIVGEESRFESFTEVIPPKYKYTYGVDPILNVSVVTNKEEVSPQKFSTYIKKFNAQGQEIASAVEETFVEEGTGELPLAPRRPPLFKLNDPDNLPPPDTDPAPQEYRYLIQSKGYSASNPVGGSESFTAATTFDQAITGARCKLAVENWRNGFTETLQIEGRPDLKEGGPFTYWCNGQYRTRTILSASTTDTILGSINGMPKVTSVTSLTLGRRDYPTVTFDEIPIPPDPEPPQADLTTFQIIDQTLGSGLDWSIVVSRRKPDW